MVKQRSLGPDNLDTGDDASSAFLDALRTRAMDEMHIAALEYGIVLKDLGECSLSLVECAIRLIFLRKPSLIGNSRGKLLLRWTS